MAEDRMFVYFSCQRCLQPLKLDDSLNSLGEHILAELSLPVHHHPDIDIQSQAVNYDRYVHPCQLSYSGNGANGFMVISDGAEVETMSSKLEVQAKLFDMLSDCSNIDHPLCDECADSIVEILEQQLKLTERDYEDYSVYLKKLENETQDIKLSDLERELQDITNEEHRLIEELAALKLEENETLKAIDEQKEVSNHLNKEEERYWKEYTRHRREYMQTDDEHKSLELQLQYTKAQYAKLEKTNVFNVTFHIWHHGHFGTINNFKLGRLPSSPVDWSEINAAWGQSALLLTALARKVNLTFDKYRLVPFGNHSYIEVLGENREYPLYGSGGFRFLWDSKFDSAMVAFLELLEQFKECVEKTDENFRLPYSMTKGKIEDTVKGISYSMKVQFNSEEQWTKALKFMLTNLKWSLTWVSSQFKTEEEPFNV